MTGENETLWFVETPTYSYHEVVLDDGTGPTYDIQDCEELHAPTRREAIAEAVRRWLKEPYDNYCKNQQRDGMSPYTGIKATSDAEAKEQCRAAGPPEWASEWCETCKVVHNEDDQPLYWIWLDDGIDEDLRWGWFGTCGMPT